MKTERFNDQNKRLTDFRTEPFCYLYFQSLPLKLLHLNRYFKNTPFGVFTCVCQIWNLALLYIN